MPEAIEKNLMSQVIAKAWKDETFKRELLNNPRATIERVFGHAIPAHVEIKVVEETPDTLYLILPAQQDTGGELTDEELMAVAGGGGGPRPPKLDCPPPDENTVGQTAMATASPFECGPIIR